MRIVPCTIVLACLLVGQSGCQLFNKKGSGEGDAPFLGAKNKDEKPKPSDPTDPLIGAGQRFTDLDGILAGRVIDGTGQPADAQIRWVCLDDPKDDGAPIDVAVNAQGYFMIQGLKTGKHYRLVTHARSGDKTLEVVTLTEAPNSRLLIQVNEKFAMPAAPEKSKGKKAASAAAEQPASAQIPLPGTGWQQPNPTILPAADMFIDKTKIADAGIPRPPVAVTPGPGALNNGWQGAVKITAPVPAPPSAPAPVPSCVKVGLRLENFALYDISLQPWELKSKRQGKLILLDFWKTNCVPCLQTIPTLRILQDKYAPAGLEVIGVAYEDGGTLLEQAHKITAVAQQRQTNYQLLLGGGVQCPLKRDLQVRSYPTLVLIDEAGNIVWQHEGTMDRAQVEDLEFAIKRRLAPR